MTGGRVLITTDAVGGVWRYSLNLAQAVTALGWRATLAVFGPTCSPQQRAEAEGLPLVETGCALDWTARSRAELEHSGRVAAQLANVLGCDLVHLHTPAFAPAFPIPVTATCHSCSRTWAEAVHGDAVGLDWRAQALRHGMLAADVLLAPTQAFARAVASSYALPRPPQPIHNGRCIATISDSAAPAPHAFTAARLWDEAKNAATLDAAAALTATPIMAAGPTKHPAGGEIALQALKLLGPLSAAEMDVQLARRPIFISAALYEPFGLAALEAAQHGCALVLSDIPTHRELWGDAALFADPHDAPRFAALLDALQRNPEVRTSWGETARQRSRHYCLDVMTRRTLAAWKQAARRRAARRSAAA